MDYITKDSGQRETFPDGAVRDVRIGKGRFDLVTPVGLRRLAGVYERGSLKYEARNWEKGIPVSRCLDSALRHIFQYIENKLRGLPQDEDHLAQAAWNLLASIHMEEMRPDLDDIKPVNPPAEPDLSLDEAIAKAMHEGVNPYETSSAQEEVNENSNGEGPLPEPPAPTDVGVLAEERNWFERLFNISK